MNLTDGIQIKQDENKVVNDKDFNQANGGAQEHGQRPSIQL